MPNKKWKDENFNLNIKVSQAVVDKLRKGTKATNIAAANKPGASAELKEAVRRFYGKNTVKTGPVNKFPPTKYPQPEKPKKPIIDRGPGMPKPTQAQIAAGKEATKKANNAKLTPNNREDRRSVPRTNTPGPGGRNVRPTAPKGGPGSKPRPSKGQTPNQREGRRSVPTIKKSGGPGAKPRTKKYYMTPGG